MLTNYHCHSHFCDGTSELEAYVKKALLLGVKALGFSSHSPIAFLNTWSMKQENLDLYFQEIDRLAELYAGKIEIYKSLEIDYIPQVTGPEKFSGLDYKLASLHYCGQFEDGSYLEVDGSSVLFKNGIDKIYASSVPDFLTAYWGNLTRLATSESTDIIGHIDKIKIHNTREEFWKHNDPYYHGLVETFLDAVSKTDARIEVNTRGVYKKKCDEPYPGSQILAMMQQRKIGIVLNSDSHTPDELVKSYETGTSAAQKAGYKNSWHFFQHQWIELALDLKL